MRCCSFRYNGDVPGDARCLRLYRNSSDNAPVRLSAQGDRGKMPHVAESCMKLDCSVFERNQFDGRPLTCGQSTREPYFLEKLMDAR